MYLHFPQSAMLTAIALQLDFSEDSALLPYPRETALHNAVLFALKRRFGFYPLFF
jgi:hypothetical protein